MILAYRILTNILYPFLFIFLYLRVLLKKEDPTRYKEKILVKHFNVTKTKNYELLWFHAASVGEFKSIIPIIKDLNEKKSNIEFLITTATLSSGQLAKSELQKFNNAYHRFMPMDVNYLIEKFLILWKPKRIFLIDSEIWPNLILKAKENNIPISLLNARLTKKSFNRWKIFSKTAEKIFRTFNLCICSNQETKEYLQIFKVQNVKYFGNLKLINEIDKKELSSVNDEILSKSRFWVASSIHQEEDVFCIKTHLEIKKKYPDVVLIIAPRHLDKVNKIKLISEGYNLKTQVLNFNEKIHKETEVVIINSFGVLQYFYKYAKSVFIGKSMVTRLKNDSGQNPLPAAYLNCKIYHGPYVSNFFEIYESLKKKDLSKKIENISELSNFLIKDLENIKKNENNHLKSFQSLSDEILSKSMDQIKNFI